MTSGKELNSICYKHNPLVEVIARIDLVSPVQSIATELPKDFAKTVLLYFPIDEPKPAFSQELLMSSKELLTRKREFTEWNFFGRKKEKRLTITHEAFFIAYSHYENYETLRDEFKKISDSFFEHFPQAQPSRLGLRYINQLQFPGTNPLEWHEYITDDLLGMFSFGLENAKASRIFHNLEFLFDGFNLRFQFGIFNPDYPAPIRRRVFILDYDAYYKGLLEAPDITKALDSYHFQIQTLFERNITDTTRRKLNEQEKR